MPRLGDGPQLTGQHDVETAFGCCALDDDRGTGHEGPCEAICSTCEGVGECPECDGEGDDCPECDGGGSCPAGCYEGRMIDEVYIP
jgi:hypothetical protein